METRSQERAAQERVAVVTGAGTGIGRATARMFAAEGTRVVVVGRRAEPLAETAAGHDLIHPLPADITGEGAAEEIVRHVVETHGRLDVLVNNAAIVQSATLDATTPEAMDATSGTCWRRGSRSTTSGRSPRAWTAT